MLREVGLLEKEHTFASNLSGGQKRKLSVALALTGSPTLCILDEPTSGTRDKGAVDAPSERGVVRKGTSRRIGPLVGNRNSYPADFFLGGVSGHGTLQARDCLKKFSFLFLFLCPFKRSELAYLCAPLSNTIRLLQDLMPGREIGFGSHRYMPLIFARSSRTSGPHL